MIFVYIGWIATAAYLTAHAYLAIKPNYIERIFYGLNFVGATGFIISSAAILSWQSVVINVFWAFISVAFLSSGSIMPKLTLSRWVIITPSFAIILASGVISLYNLPLAVNTLGWAGTVLYVSGYFLFSTGTIRKWQYLFFNTIAALILLPVYHLDGNWPAYALSVAWSAISIVGLWTVRSTIEFKL